MRTTILLTIASTLLSLVVATPAGTLSTPNTNALLPLGARSALKGCWEQCSNHLQCQGLCNRCSNNGRCHRPANGDSETEAEAEVAAPVSLPRDETVDAIAYKGCWEQCSNHLQCQGLCNRCSDNGRCHRPAKRDEDTDKVVAAPASAPVSLPRDEAAEAVAYKGCWEPCSNHLQCQGICNRCSDTGHCHKPQ